MESLSTKMVVTEKNGNIGIIKLNRPEKRNALNPELISAISSALYNLEKDDDIGAIIITGEGKAFCAGADLEYLMSLRNNSAEENRKDSKLIADLFLQIYNSNKITIAAVNGAAIAGGCGLATVCDYVIADKNHAKFGYSEVKIGFVAAIVSVFLIKRLGEAKARQLLISGDIINAEQAVFIGMADYISESPLKYAIDYASNSEGNSKNSISLTKQMIRTISVMDVNTAVNYCIEMNAVSRSSEDFAKGLQSFLSKEK